MTKLLNVHDYQKQAAKKLAPMTYGYYASGANSQITLRENEQAWQDIRLRPRTFVGVANRSSTTKVLGERISFPAMAAPMAFQQLADPTGELGVAEATGEAGTIYCLSTLSNYPVEKVVKATNKPVWFQLYVVTDREATMSLIDRVTEAGCTGIIVTVDTPELGFREADERHEFVLPKHFSFPNLPQDSTTLREQKSQSALSRFAKYSLDGSLTWKDFEHFAKRTNVPLIAKGILRADDAQKAVDHGAKAVIVSNHGGRQLDTSIPTAWALPEIVSQVGSQTEVYVDGGIRRGSDILKALALGATAVLVGRPLLWGLSTNGSDGCRHILEILKTEFDLAMALSGCRSVKEITPDLLWKPNKLQY